MAHLSGYRRSARKRAVCPRIVERERRLRSTRCVCLCEPPRLIVIPQQRLSIFCTGTAANARALDTNAATTVVDRNRNAEESRAFGLQVTSEADNCASALWLFSFATASVLLRSACCCFAYRAKNIRSARCQKSSGSSPIRQRESGPKKAKSSLKNRHPRRTRRKLFRTKIVRQRRSYGQTHLRNLAPKLNGYAAGRAVHHRQRSCRAFLLLRHEVGPDRLHGALHFESVWCACADEFERGVHVHTLLRFRRLLSPDPRRRHRRRLAGQILDYPLALDGLLLGQSHARVHGHFLGDCNWAASDAGDRTVSDLSGCRRD